MLRATTAETNAARAYSHIAVSPIAGALGAEISGVDLRALSDESFDEIHTALLDHGVIFFRDQDLSLDDQEAFTVKFGPYGEDPFIEGMEGRPHVLRLVKEADEKSPFVFGGAWHSDWSFFAEPPMATFLYAKDVPPYGGDTLYASMTLAYDLLSDEMKRVLESLTAVHSARRGYGPNARATQDQLEHMNIKTGEEALARQEHPLVRTHPETGRKSLYINPVYTVGIKGMDQEEADAILNFLYAHARHEAFTCRFRWQVGSLAVWDNRCTMHQPLSDFLGFRREMYRTTAAGDRPFLSRDN